MAKLTRSASRPLKLQFNDEEQEQTSSPSYFEWRETTVRTVARSFAPAPRPSLLLRLFRRVTGRS